MTFQFAIPSASPKNAMRSFGLFVVFSAFFCFQIYLYCLQTASIVSEEELSNAFMEDFRAGGGSASPRRMITPKKVNNNTIEFLESKDSFQILNKGPISKCTPFSVASHFEPTTGYRKSTTLPQWMKDYFDWHREQTLIINECNLMDYKFLILRCTQRDGKCGGVADRLRSLPFFIAAAAKTKRIFLIRWTRPTKMEEFLLPNEINWSVPDWMYKYAKFNETHLFPKADLIDKALARARKWVLEGLVQDFYGGSKNYYKYESLYLDPNKTFDEDYMNEHMDHTGWDIYEVIFRDLFYTLFEPTPPIAKLVREKMMSGNLVPGKFAASHYRAFYGVEHKKDVRDNAELSSKTQNALNCASKLQPGDPIYFASDSRIAVQFARNLSETTGRRIVTSNDEKEALHLDKPIQWKSRNVSDYYPTFVDLLIMSEANCISQGLGGFARFAKLLSIDSNCTIRHDDKKPRMRETCRWYDSIDDLKEDQTS